MDNFIDKFALRKNAQEMIRANAMAEAEEKEKMATKLFEYELAMQELRRCNLQNIENAEKVKELLTASLNKIEEVQKKDEESSGKSEKALEEMRSLLEVLEGRVTELFGEQQSQTKELLELQKKTIEDLLHAAEEFNHKEAVKVYRNVQAVIESTLPKQTEEIGEMIKNAKTKKGVSVWMIVIGVLTFAAAAANVVIEVLKILGYL